MYKNFQVTQSIDVDQAIESGISQEKLDWMNEIGMKEFIQPMKYTAPYYGVYSAEYIKNTSLDELKRKYIRSLPIDED